MSRFHSKSRFYTHIFVISVSVFMQFFGSSSGQSTSITTPCSTSMISTFTPCMNYVTGSSNNGTTPTGDCCKSLRTIITAGIDCACLILTANVPLPTNGVVNRALTISLPSICNSPRIPIQCQATGAPVPPPGPVLFAPPPPPSAITPRGGVTVPLAAQDTTGLPPAAAPDTTSLPVPTPAAAPVDVEAPSESRKGGDQIRSVLIPSDSSPGCAISYQALIMLVYLGIMVLKLY